MSERDAAGWAVLEEAVAAAREVLGARLVGVYAVGSLVHGGFAEDVSDVDGVVVVDRCDQRVPALVADVTRRVRQRGGPLAERLSLFWGDWATFGAPPDSARLPPIVRRDLLDDGVALWGAEAPGGLPAPSRDDLVRETAAFAAGRLEGEGLPEAAALVAAGRRPLTKTALFPVRFLATIHAGLSGSNDAAVAWYAGTGGEHAPLARAALAWRTAEIEDAAAAEALVAAHLAGLWREAVDACLADAAVPEATRARLRLARKRGCA